MKFEDTKNQIDIFSYQEELLKTNILNEIRKSIEKNPYDDKYLKEYKGNYCLISEIANGISAIEGHDVYIKKLFIELSKYLPVFNIDELWDQNKGICFQDDSIRVKSNKKLYSIWCFEELDKNIFEQIGVN